jgi:hypothetical protein
MTPIEVDVVAFVRWLLTQPLLQRVKPLSDRELLGAARLLHVAAIYGLEEAPSGLSELIAQLTDWAIREGSGRVGHIRECLRTLESLQTYWHRSTPLQQTIDWLRRLPPEKVRTTCQMYMGQHNNRVTYRAADGTGWMGPRRKGKQFKDDLSERIWIARDVLKKAGCPSPISTIAAVLNDSGTLGPHCTPQKVNARLAPHKQKAVPAWPDNPWFYRYWIQCCCSRKNIAITNEQPFVLKWHAIPNKRQTTHLRVVK